MITLKVKGMTCGHCEMAVEQAIAKVPGVARVVEVSRGRGRALVEGTPDPAKLVEAVRDEGYDAEIAR
ncbi:MAG: heavy-metal-associated domain-containing protein [Proteobacteria bacterium]|nr:heavy-metal-associated domain-containing protein [Pseudomonadota bacterium]